MNENELKLINLLSIIALPEMFNTDELVHIACILRRNDEPSNIALTFRLLIESHGKMDEMNLHVGAYMDILLAGRMLLNLKAMSLHPCNLRGLCDTYTAIVNDLSQRENRVCSSHVV